jgi:predicted acylesterase/phospholipase RssA
MYTTLVMSGGGAHVAAFVGAVDALSRELREVRNVVGSSGGALIALLITVGLDASSIRAFVLRIVEELKEVDPPLDHAMALSFGMMRSTFLEELLERVFHLLNLPNSTTFADLAKLTGRNLVVCTTNITEGKVVYFSTDTNPLLLVQHALLMSCSVPILFPPYMHEGCLYVDSIFTKNFPIDYAKHRDAGSTLGLNIVNRVHHVPDITSYIVALYNAAVLCAHSDECDEKLNDRVHVHNIDCTGLDNFDSSHMSFVVSKALVEEHIARGRAAVSTRESSQSS